MPYTGYDPFQGSDQVGGSTDVGLDPSAYYAMSPGGRFGGDTWAYLEYLAGLGRGASGSFDLDNLHGVELTANQRSAVGRLAPVLQWFGQHSTPGQPIQPPGGYPYNFYSGPAARYGPLGGPLHGLVDQGNAGLFEPDPGPNPDGGSPPPRRSGGGGGGGGGGYTFTPYGGMQQQGRFVDWQPTTPGQPHGPTRYVPGRGSSTPRLPAGPPPAPAGRRNARGGAAGSGSGAGAGTGGGGAGGGARRSGGPAPARSGAQAPPPPPGFFDWLEGLVSPSDRRHAGYLAVPGQALRQPDFRGYDVGNLDRGMPGHLSDPTTSLSRPGFPNPTPRAPMAGETSDSYMTWLHDAGFSQDDIASLVGRNGYHVDPQSGELGGWQWGAGPVVRGGDGYQFANQGGSGPAPARTNAADELRGDGGGGGALGGWINRLLNLI